MKIALVLPSDFGMWRFRKGLIKTLMEKGNQVYLITPPGPYVAKLTTLGVTHISMPMYRFFSPFQDIRLGISLYKVFRKEQFDIVHNMTIKPVLYGSIAAKIAGINKIVGLISGMGFLFSAGSSVKISSMRMVVEALLRMSFVFCDRVWVQNPDDIDYMVSKKLISRGKTVLIKGSGVDLDEFSVSNITEDVKNKIRKEFDINEINKVVTMIAARLVWPKGVSEFLKAGKILTEKYNNVKFILVAPIELQSPETVPMEFVQAYCSSNVIAVMDFRDDVKEIMAISDIVVLPSYYKEGVPRVLLEALALGKPIITADTSGCREAVEDGYNGFIVPPKDCTLLAEAIEKCIINEQIRLLFSKNSRKKAEKEFDERDVVKRAMKELYGVIV